MPGFGSSEGIGSMGRLSSNSEIGSSSSIGSSSVGGGDFGCAAGLGDGAESGFNSPAAAGVVLIRGASFSTVAWLALPSFYAI